MSLTRKTNMGKFEKQIHELFLSGEQFSTGSLATKLGVQWETARSYILRLKSLYLLEETQTVKCVIYNFSKSSYALDYLTRIMTTERRGVKKQPSRNTFERQKLCAEMLRVLQANGPVTAKDMCKLLERYTGNVTELYRTIIQYDCFLKLENHKIMLACDNNMATNFIEQYGYALSRIGR
jgi:predicted HTH transcriptional regulator